MTPISLENRAVLSVEGDDAPAFLQGLITHDIGLLAPGRAVFAGLLSAQGKALFDFHLHAGDGGAILIDVVAGKADALLKRLSMYKLRKAVTLARRDDLAVLATWPANALANAPANAPANALGDAPANALGDARTPALGARWIAAVGTALAGADVYDAHRHAVGVPDSDDIGSDDLLWLETDADLLDGVSFAKGCYVGQENTARMHHRDKVRRRLVPVMLAGEPGDAVEVKDDQARVCGKLRSRRGDHAIVHLRVEAAAGPLFLGDAAVMVRRPDWLESAW